MNKKIIAVICIAVLALSFASARVVNFALGASFGSFKGVAPLSDDDKDKNTPYEGKGFGIDATLSFTFGSRAELFFQEVFNFSDKTVFGEGGEENFIGTLDYKSYTGYEHALITGPVKLSLGVAAVVEAVTSIYQYQVGDELTTMFPVVINFGIGATLKAEFELGKHLAFYAKANADYLPYSVFAIAFNPSEEEPATRANTTNNFSFGASAGLVLYF